VTGLHLKSYQGSVVLFGINIFQKEIICLQCPVEIISDAVCVCQEIEGVIWCPGLAQPSSPVLRVYMSGSSLKPGDSLVLFTRSIKVTLANAVIEIIIFGINL